MYGVGRGGVCVCVYVHCWLLLHFVLGLYVMKWNVIDKCVCAGMWVYVEILPRSVLDVGLYFTLECYSHLFTILHSKTGNSTIVLTDYLFTTLHHTTSISTMVLTDTLFTTPHRTTSISTIVLFVHYPIPYNQHPHHGADYLFTTPHRTTSISTIVLFVHYPTPYNQMVLTDYLFTTQHRTTIISTIVLTICSLPNTVQPSSPPWCYLFTTQHRTTSISTMVLTICSLPYTVQPASPPWCWLFVHYPTPYNQHPHHGADYLFTTLHHKSCIPTTVLTDHLCTAILQEQIKLVVKFILQEVGEVIRVNLAWE